MTGFFIKTFIAFFTVLLAISCSDNSVTNPDDLAASTWGSGSSSSDTSVVLLSGGCFEMGGTDGSSNETPVHKVCVSPFYMDRHEVTNAEYIAAMGDSAHFDDDKCGIFNADSGQSFYGTLPASFRSDNQPMVCVDWSQAEAYCESQGKRLPTEAEWEYAARAGTTTDFFWGSVVTGGCAYGNISDKTKLSDGSSWSNAVQCTDGYGEVTSPVGSFSPNPWGFYDMTGNVREWTHDWYDSSYYAASPAANPWGPSAETYRVNRGGAWNSSLLGTRISYRSGNTPDYSDNALGFRCVASNATPGSASSLSSSSYGASSSSVYTNPNISYGSFMDLRDSKTYRTAVIGTQTWMAQNLNYKTDSSWCYGNKDSNCSKYGRLYSWAAAMGLSSSYNKSHWGGGDINRQGVCPSGWHLPSDSEWTVLANYVSKTSNMGNMDDDGDWSAIGQLLKSSEGWYDTTSAGKGINAFGFTALAAGVADSSNFLYDSLGSAWWSSTEQNDDQATDRFLFYADDNLSLGGDLKVSDFSVRCLEDPAGLSSSVNSSSSGGASSSSAIGPSSSSTASSSSLNLSSSSSWMNSSSSSIVPQSASSHYFHWSGDNDDGTGRVITGLDDGTDLSGYWYDWKDSLDGGTSAFAWPSNVMTNEYGNFYGPLVTTYRGITGTADLKTGYDYPFLGLGFNLVNDKRDGTDISGWDGMCITYASTKDFHLELVTYNEASTVKYNNYKVTLPAASTSYSTLNIPWTNFKQESGWGVTLPQSTALAEIAAIRLQFMGVAGTQINFFIYEIGSYGTCGTTTPPTLSLKTY